MKKVVMIGVVLVAIIGILVFQSKYGASTAKTEMGGHQVISLMSQHYSLDGQQTKQLEETLSQLDGLIEESFNEALANNEANAKLVKSRFEHMQRVSYLAIQLMIAYEQAEGISFTVEQAEDLMIAGYLHDIRKYAQGNHAKQGEKYVVAYVPGYVTMDESRLERIGRLIKYHSDPLSDKQREKLGDDVILEELLQDADTADKILNRGQDTDDNVTTLNLQSSVDFVKQYDL